MTSDNRPADPEAAAAGAACTASSSPCSSSPSSFTVRMLVVATLAILNGALFLAYEQQHTPSQRMNYLRFGLAPQPIQVHMLMGVQRGPVKCPKGMFRPPGAGPSLGECRYCPRGVYGDSPGLVSSDCTAKCPKGTYQDKPGATSVLDCKACPAGVFGSAPGLTSSACSAPCPYGKYSMKTGLQSMSECDDCPANYRGPQGYRGNNPYTGTEGGMPCDRYINGKTVLTGRDIYANALRDAYFANPRYPHTEIIDNT